MSMCGEYKVVLMCPLQVLSGSWTCCVEGSWGFLVEWQLLKPLWCTIPLLPAKIPHKPAGSWAQSQAHSWVLNSLSPPPATSLLSLASPQHIPPVLLSQAEVKRFRKGRKGLVLPRHVPGGDVKCSTRPEEEDG